MVSVILQHNIILYFTSYLVWYVCVPCSQPTYMTMLSSSKNVTTDRLILVLSPDHHMDLPKKETDNFEAIS